MRTSAKNALGFSLLVVIIAICGFAGLRGISTLGGTLDMVLGPFWGTADGAMEGTIELKSQVLTLHELTDGAPLEASRAAIEELSPVIAEAFQRMRDGELIEAESIATLGELEAAYFTALTGAIDAHASERTSREACAGASDRLLAAVDDLAAETAGDVRGTAAIERVRSVVLGQVLDLHRAILGELEPGSIAKELPDRFFALERAADPFLPDPEDDLAGQPEAAAFASAIGGFRGTLDTVLADVAGAQRADALLARSSGALLDLLGELEEEVEEPVDNQVDEIVAVKARARAMILGALLLGIAVAVIAGTIITRSIAGPIRSVAEAMHDIAEGEGNLTSRLDESRGDEVGDLARAFNQFVEKIQAILQQVQSSVTNLDASSGNLEDLFRQLDAQVQVTAGQAGAVDEASGRISSNTQAIAASAEQLGSSIQDIANSANHAASVATSTCQMVENASEVFASLETSSYEIERVMTLIKNIAEQTNLLALNATIEAARAGEAGKGFGVVANEVKDLANATARATKETQEQIHVIQGNTRSALAAIENVRESMRSMSEVTTTIAGAVEEQNAVAKEIAKNVSDAAVATNEITRNIADVAAAASQAENAARSSSEESGSMLGQTRKISELVGQFQLS